MMGGPCALFGLVGRPASHPRKTLSRLAAAIVRSRASQLERSQWGRPFWLSREIFAQAGLRKAFRSGCQTVASKAHSTPDPTSKMCFYRRASGSSVLETLGKHSFGR